MEGSHSDASIASTAGRGTARLQFGRRRSLSEAKRGAVRVGCRVSQRDDAAAPVICRRTRRLRAVGLQFVCPWHLSQLEQLGVVGMLLLVSPHRCCTTFLLALGCDPMSRRLRPSTLCNIYLSHPPRYRRHRHHQEAARATARCFCPRPVPCASCLWSDNGAEIDVLLRPRLPARAHAE